MNRSFTTLALLAVGFTATSALAAPADLFFSTTPFPTAGTLTPSNPTLNLTVGQTATLYMWVGFPNTNDSLNALGVDILSSNTPVITGSSATLVNPAITVGRSSAPRWDSASTGTPNSAGKLFPSLNAFAVTAHGMDPNADPDADNNGIGTDIYFGSITFTAAAAGSTSLFFDVSSQTISYTGSSPDVNGQFINFGTGDSAVSGITAGNTSSLADATIIVTPNATPEPASLTLLAIGGLTLINRRRKA